MWEVWGTLGGFTHFQFFCLMRRFYIFLSCYLLGFYSYNLNAQYIFVIIDYRASNRSHQGPEVAERYQRKTRRRRRRRNSVYPYSYFGVTLNPYMLHVNIKRSRVMGRFLYSVWRGEALRKHWVGNIPIYQQEP